MKIFSSNGMSTMPHSKNAVTSSWYSKRSLDTAMFLEVIKAFHHKEVGVTP
jgi:hypothetical protein